ncbi:hypothetical protein [Pelosinus sp. IPA-1]|uniref:hypothetical protein n=1 Tax=Pelosinus sp. IPA-1 TaxID=3029569 RepID=UPI00243614D7|nr:hypothetical protein [Pelosinus sp. IPA-1]GMB01097.1 hypothetical protein PIPA1_38960 [Pelosinus sp. IPA-1]
MRNQRVKINNVPDKFWPVIDYKLKNIGDQIGIITKMKIKVNQCLCDADPELYFQLMHTSENDLQIRVVNLGWGKATDVEIVFFPEGINQYLKCPLSIWRGEVDDFEIIKIDKCSISIDKKVAILPGHLSGQVKYKNIDGRCFSAKVKYDILPRYPSCKWNLTISPEGFNVITYPPEVMYSLLTPTATYNVLLSPSEKPFEVLVDVSQAIKPNEGDRFQLVVASTCSATYHIESCIEIDGSTILNIGEVIVPVKFKRYLPNFGYRAGLNQDLDDEDADLLKIASKQNDILEKYGQLSWTDRNNLG